MATIIGTIGDDNLTGGSGDDLIYGYDPADQANTDGGNDTLNGAGGNDSLFGGNGNDILIGGAGNDTLDGGPGADSMSGGLGDDVYAVSAISDTVIEGLNEGIDMILDPGLADYTMQANVENLTILNGGASTSTARGNALDNLIIGNDSNNIIYTNGGNDTLAGGEGHDTYRIGGDQNTVIIENAGEGLDTVYAGSSYTLAANLEWLYLTGVADLDAVGNDQANSIHGNISDNVLEGREGNDQLRGLKGNDTLIGGAGSDSLDGGEGYDTADFSGSDHAITAFGEYFDGTAFGNGDFLVRVERVLGSAFDDTFDLNWPRTAVGLQLIDGGAGNDTFFGGSQGLIFDGGAGNDNISGGTGQDTLIGGAGNDTMDGGGDSDTADYSAATTAVTVNLGLTGPQNTGTGTGIDALSNIENLTGSGTVRDNLTGNGLGNVLLGLNGNDVLAGGAGNDILDGGNSNDTLNGDAGDDRLIGGDGTDLMYGDAGIDTADYTGDGRAVNVSLTLTTAQDTGYGLDTLSGIENLIAGSGNDRLVGSTAANLIRGGTGNDGVVALGGADSLYGENGDDTMQGGAGNDLLVGGAGADELVGGADADTFLYGAIAETVAGPAHDTINDFQQGLDHVDLSAIDANVLASGDQAFSFIGSVAFSHAAAQLRQAGDGAGNTIIEGDVQGDGVADFQILLKGTYTLTSSDFVL